MWQSIGKTLQALCTSEAILDFHFLEITSLLGLLNFNRQNRQDRVLQNRAWRFGLKFPQVSLIGRCFLYRPVNMSRSISTVDADSHMGEYSRYRQSMSIHLRDNTVDINDRFGYTYGELRSIVDRRLSIEIILWLVEPMTPVHWICKLDSASLILPILSVEIE